MSSSVDFSEATDEFALYTHSLRARPRTVAHECYSEEDNQEGCDSATRIELERRWALRLRICTCMPSYFESFTLR